jgi:hypothetical protein
MADSPGNYAAPVVTGNIAVEVVNTSKKDPSKSASASGNVIASPIAVMVWPQSAVLFIGETAPQLTTNAMATISAASRREPPKTAIGSVSVIASGIVATTVKVQVAIYAYTSGAGGHRERRI